MDPAVEIPPAIDDSLPGLEEVRMQEQLINSTTISPISKHDLIPATTREEPIIAEPLPGLEEDVKMQEDSVAHESTQPKSVSSLLYSKTRNDLICFPQRSRNSNQFAPPWRFDRAPAADQLFSRTKRIKLWTWYL